MNQNKNKKENDIFDQHLKYLGAGSEVDDILLKEISDEFERGDFSSLDPQFIKDNSERLKDEKQRQRKKENEPTP